MLLTAPFARRQAGLSLVELMVSLTIGLIVLAAVTNLVVGGLRSNSETQRMARLNQELRAVMHLMVSELRRADMGVDGDTDCWPANAPASDSYYHLTIVSEGDQSANRIEYKYDANGDGYFPDGSVCRPLKGRCAAGETAGIACPAAPVAVSAADTERFAFRRTVNGAGIGRIQMRRNGTWQDLTDPAVTHITTLQFCFWSPGTADAACPLTVPASARTGSPGDAEYVEIRNLRIRLSGQLVSDANVNRAFNEIVKVRNNALFDDDTP